jgi:hypothetical protein
MTKTSQGLDLAEWLDSRFGGAWFVNTKTGERFQGRDGYEFSAIIRLLKAASGVDKTDALGALDGMVIGESPFPAEWISVAVRKIRALLSALPDTEISQSSQTEGKK